MRKCPVHNCPAKTGARIAIIVASVIGLFIRPRKKRPTKS